MLDDFLTEALGRLDRRILEVCAEEERRAALLAGDGGHGWAAVRNLVRLPVADLLTPATGAPTTHAAPQGLVPADEHVLRRVGAGLGLAELELEVLLVLLSVHVEPRYQSVYAVLQDDLRQPRPTERVLHALLGRYRGVPGELSRALGGSGRLAMAGLLVRPAGAFAPLARPLDLPEDAVAALLGDPEPPVPQAVSLHWTSATGADATPAAARRQVVFGGGDVTAAARDLAPAGRRLLVVRPPAEAATATEVARAAWRGGLATGALPLLDLRDLAEDAALEVARAVEDLPGGGDVWVLARDPVPIAVPHVEAAAPTWPVRRDAWLAEAALRGVPLTAEQAGALAARHRLDARAIARVHDVALSAHRTAGGLPETLPTDRLDRVAGALGTEHVRLSRRTVPMRGFDDLVLRDTTREALGRLVHYVQHRDEISAELDLEHRFQVRRGPIALFSGLSGTGKTLAVEAVAGALGRPLHTVDLARLVSKYIGETEKHVDEVMRQAETASAVLFFDEADALFGTRAEKASSAGEHFSNMLVGYLLQRIELHDGPVVLATNLSGGIDEAFLRRFQFRIEFPMPEPLERERIWRLMLPTSVPCAADVDLGRLAKAHRLAGGEIRNAALKAVFRAHRNGTPLRHDDLEHAVAVELLELGRLSRHAGGVAGEYRPDRGELLRAGLDDLHDQLEACLRHRFLKNIHLVHGSPTDDRLAGRKPAVSIALFRLAARRGADGLRAGFVVSAWSHVAEEESELLGVVHEALAGMTPAPVHGRPARLRVSESHDFDLLHRFWSSHDHPVRASVVVDLEIE